MEKRIVEKLKEACEDLQVQIIISEEVLGVMSKMPVAGRDAQTAHLQSQLAVEHQLNINKLTLANLKEKVKKAEEKVEEKTNE